MTTVNDILIQWLCANGYDGLATDGCGCHVTDMMPCSSYCGSCVPGHNEPRLARRGGSTHWVVPGKRRARR
jgi:hypothetical protein